jgi:hypothetical protein
MAALAGGQAEGQRDVGLAGAAVAQQQHVLAAQQELRARQFQHHGLVQRGDGQEVEAVQALDHGNFACRMRRSVARRSRSSNSSSVMRSR